MSTTRYHVGHYNFADSTQEQALLEVMLPEGAPIKRVSAAVRVGGDYDPGQAEDPMSMLALIKRYYTKGVIFSTAGDENLAAIEWAEAHEIEVMRAYLEEELRFALIQLERAEKRVESLRSELQDLADPTDDQLQPPSKKAG